MIASDDRRPTMDDGERRANYLKRGERRAESDLFQESDAPSFSLAALRLPLSDMVTLR